jgi:DNA repair exonuclease SbcCD nuclease subunit
MSNLFQRAIVFTDIHFGAKSNSQLHNEDCWRFVQWATELGRSQNCDACFFLGDWHNNRSTINILTLNYSLRALEHLNANFRNVFFIPGNHDLYYRDKRDVQSVEWARHLPNVQLANDWIVDQDVVIAPWLVGQDHKRIPKLKGRYLFGHLELPKFLMNARVEMPDHGEVKHEHFSGFERVFTGHFHMRQTRNNITYIGNCFPHNYSDAGDDARGAMILEWGQEPEFHTWPDQPTYRVYNLSDVLTNTDNLLKSNMHARVTIDVDISYEEAAYVKETLVNQFGMRDLSLVPRKDLSPEAQGLADLSFQSVDQIVSDQINSIDSEQYDPRLLLEIYRNL